jgi:hypothetical protein
MRLGMVYKKQPEQALACIVVAGLSQYSVLANPAGEQLKASQVYCKAKGHTPAQAGKTIQ